MEDVDAECGSSLLGVLKVVDDVGVGKDDVMAPIIGDVSDSENECLLLQLVSPSDMDDCESCWRFWEVDSEWLVPLKLHASGTI